MKRQDVSGVERLAVDSTGGGGGSDVNLTGINGVTPSTGHGAADTGTLRVELPTDGTGHVVASDETSTIYNGTTAVTVQRAAISCNTNGDNTIVGAGTNKIRVLAWNLMASGTVNAKWQSGASGTDLTGLYYLIANTGISVPYNPKGWFETASATLLNLNLSAGTAVGGNIVYVDVA